MITIDEDTMWVKCDSLDDYATHAVERDSDWSRSQESRAGKDESFYGPDSFQQCVDRVRTGWREGYQRLHDKLVDFKVSSTLEDVPTIERDVSGFAFDVPAYIAGDPACMLSQTDSPEREVTRLMVCRTASWLVTPEQIENYGVAMMATIEKLESEGKSVELSVYFASTSGSYKMREIVKIKSAGEYMSEDSLAFVFAHTGMLRRLHFGVVEGTPNEWNFCHGYGTVDNKWKPEGDYVNFPMIDNFRNQCESVESAIGVINGILAKQGTI